MSHVQNDIAAMMTFLFIFCTRVPSSEWVSAVSAVLKVIRGGMRF